MKAETQSFYERAVQSAVEIIAGSLDHALDLDQLAQGAALSPFHFHRVFRGMLGETPLQLHRRLRLERAAWQLTHTEEEVTTTAFAAGYDTHEAFTRAFRAHYGRSPSEFKTQAPVPILLFTPTKLPTPSAIHYGPERPGPGYVRFAKGAPGMDVKIEERPELRVATVRHIGAYHRIAEALMKLSSYIEAGQLPLDQPGPSMMAIYHDDQETTPEAELRSDAAMVVSESLKLPDGVVEQRVAAGRYASTTHIGPYEGLPDTWARFMGEWLPASGERVGDGVTYEVYVSDPMTVPPDEVRTDLYVPLA